jgi:hypothetical protein
VRNATISLFEGLDETALLREGVANNNRATVRALGYHIAGHELHHINIIKEEYLNEEVSLKANSGQTIAGRD